LQGLCDPLLYRSVDSAILFSSTYELWLSNLSVNVWVPKNVVVAFPQSLFIENKIPWKIKGLPANISEQNSY
jgi:hypothetical protein